MTENIVASDSFEEYLISHPFLGKPENLYNPMNYIMQLGGKRMRPKLLLLAFQSVSEELNKDVFQLALSIETFHNFSLLHDDIMDNAPIRRGKKTVHEEWNAATAILAGDNLLIQCYDLILKTSLPNKAELLNEFTIMATQVCEGQQMDMNLPNQELISDEEYLQMIRLKTAVLPACALKMGALAANASLERADVFYDFGLNLGMAFQLQDDYLDAFGSAEEIGKQEGGDIIENKRTLLYLHALRTLTGGDKEELQYWFNSKPEDPANKIERVRSLFKLAESDRFLMDLKADFERHALTNIDIACEGSSNKAHVLALFDLLKTRKA
jgi:geranylgeranyl diphosphate synthase type II